MAVYLVWCVEGANRWIDRAFADRGRADQYAIDARAAAEAESAARGGMGWLVPEFEVEELEVTP